jgi:hypothetical protein
MLDSRVRRGIPENLVRCSLRQLDPRFEYQTTTTTTITFYLTVLSDASVDLYPDNTIARFRLRLPKSVELLNGAWEVGLCK